MGKIAGFRRKRNHIPAFEDALAHLHEDLLLTENFAGMMIRDGNYKAALAAVDDQRTRLAAAERVMLDAFRPRVRRVQVALGGIAAIMLIGGASFAAFSLRSPEDTRSAPEVIAQAQQKIEQAAVASTDEQAHAIVADALADLSSIGGEIGGNQGLERRVVGLLDDIRSMMRNGRLRVSTRGLQAQIDEIAKKANVEAPKPEEPKPDEPSERPISGSDQAPSSPPSAPPTP